MLTVNTLIFTLIVIFFIFFCLWLFFRRSKPYEFVGAKNLIPPPQQPQEEVVVNEPPQEEVVVNEPPQEEEINTFDEYIRTAELEYERSVASIVLESEQFSVNPEDSVVLIDYSEDELEVSDPPRRFGSKGEEICCRVLESIFKKRFVKARPGFLRNPETGHNLELDCYNEELAIALEYNGQQHYVFPNRFHKTKEEFIQQTRRDMLKVNLCDANGVYLITVPYTIPHDRIEEFIISKLPENRESQN